MTVKLTWRRVGVGSGPGNILNDRFQVRRALPSKLWLIHDLDVGRVVTDGRISPARFRSMAAAKAGAEDLVRREAGDG